MKGNKSKKPVIQIRRKDAINPSRIILYSKKRYSPDQGNIIINESHTIRPEKKDGNN